MYPMSSCERCEKQRKGVNGTVQNKDAILSLLGKHIYRLARCDAMTPKKVPKWTNENRKREACRDAI